MVPAKIVRDWKTLFIAGRPLYEDDNGGAEGVEGREEGGDVQSSITSSVTSSQLSSQVDNSQLLDDADLREYRVGISILVMYSVFVGFLVST